MKIEFEIPDVFTEETRTAIEKIKTDDEVQKVTACCFWLIKMCAETNASNMDITLADVLTPEKNLGGWKINILKIEEKQNDTKS